MVSSDGETVVVDQQGRMVIPSRLRGKLGVKKGGEVLIRLQDSSVIIERRSAEDVEDRVRNWVSVAVSTKEQLAAAGGKRLTTSKWMSSEYARRKVGL